MCVCMRDGPYPSLARAVADCIVVCVLSRVYDLSFSAFFLRDCLSSIVGCVCSVYRHQQSEALGTFYIHLYVY